MNEDGINRITGDIIDSAMKIHKMFGPGMLESVYERMLAIELRKRGHVVECQKQIGFVYEGESFDDAFRLDLLVDSSVVVELKSTSVMNQVFAKQLRTYLVLSGLEIGLVVNFGMATLKEGLVRVINSHNLASHSPANLRDSASLWERESFPTEAQRHRGGDAGSLRDSASLLETNKGELQ